MKSNILSDTLADVLAHAGFRRRKGAWYREAPVGLLVLELQRSQWGKQYYLNLGVYLDELGRAQAPRAHHCHLMTRAAALDAKHEVRWRELLDLENALDPGRRTQELASLLVSQVVPFLESISTKEGIREAHAHGRLSDALVTLALKEHLGIA